MPVHVLGETVRRVKPALRFFDNRSSLSVTSGLSTAPSAVYSLQSSLLGAHVQRVPLIARVESWNLTNASTKVVEIATSVNDLFSARVIPCVRAQISAKSKFRPSIRTPFIVHIYLNVQRKVKEGNELLYLQKYRFLKRLLGVTQSDVVQLPQTYNIRVYDVVAVKKKKKKERKENTHVVTTISSDEMLRLLVLVGHDCCLDREVECRQNRQNRSRVPCKIALATSLSSIAILSRGENDDRTRREIEQQSARI